MPDTVDSIQRLVDRAEECRTLAGLVTDEDAAQSYLQLATAYEMLAEEERRLLAVRQAANIGTQTDGSGGAS